MITRTPTRTLGAALLVSALLAGACGSDAERSADTPSSAGNEASEAPSNAGSSATAQAGIKDFVFVPSDLEVPVGTTITWTNEDRFGHTVTAGAPNEETGEFDLVLGLTSDADTTGLTASHTFGEVGTFDFYCRYHPSMIGTVTVTG